MARSLKSDWVVVQRHRIGYVTILKRGDHVKIDWKHLATTPGYRSLKAAYIRDVLSGHTHNSKQRLYKKFTWVINRAKNHAYATGVSLDTVLDAWEKERGYSWTAFYSSWHQPRMVAAKRSL